MTKTNPFYSIIDIGTNSALLVVTEPDGGKLKNVIQKTASIRLGKGLKNEDKKITPESLQRLDDALRKYAQTINNTGIRPLMVLMTEAVRKSSNPEDVIEIVKKRMGIEPVTLTGEQEAKFAWNAIAHHYDDDKLLAIDVGAGSSELATKTAFLSLPLGALTLAQDETSFPGEAVLKRLIKELKTIDLKKFKKKDLLISGGTASALVMCLTKLKEFDEEKIEGFELKEEELLNYLQLAMGLNVEVLSQMPGLDQRRGEIFIPGVRIIQAFMNVLKPTSIRISTLGVRRGALIDHLDLLGNKEQPKQSESNENK